MLRISLFENERDPFPTTRDLEWADLVELLGRHLVTPCTCHVEPPPKGQDCPHKFGHAWSPVEYAACPPGQCRNVGGRAQCDGSGPHRLNVNVRNLSVAVFDLDHLSIDTVNAIAARLDEEGLAAILHSTHSHRPPADCALRLILPLSRAVPGHDVRRIRAVICRELGIPADRQTTDPARLYFLPTAPEGSDPIAVSCEGAVLPVDELLALADATPAPAAPAPAAAPAEEAGPVDVNELRRRLKRLQRTESKEIAARILKGEPLAEEGARDATLNRACGVLVGALPRGTPTEAILELLRPSINVMPGDPPACGWLAEAADMIERAKVRRAERDAQREEFNRKVRERLARESALSDEAFDEGDEEEPEAEAQEPAKNTDEEGESGDGLGYTEEQLERWAAEQGTDFLGFKSRWIVQKGKSFYVFVGGKYRSPITRDDLQVSLPRDLARAPVTLEVEDKDGNKRPLGVPSILDRYATVARTVSASLSLQRSFYDARTETFFEAVCPMRRVRVREHPEIDGWLRLLGGAQAERLLDWVAATSRLDRQACALYFDGVKSVGKNLFAAGLARLWTTGGPSELARVLDGFNDSLVSCPLLFADETLPQKKGITAELRRLIGSTSRTLRRLYVPPCSLDGAIRLVIAGNNDRLLDTGEELSTDDLDAVAGRFLYVKPDPRAAEYLADLGGPPVLQHWIDEDLIAEHSLFLRNTRTLNERSRFLVEGTSSEFHDHLATNNGLSGLVCEWLARYLADPNTGTNGADPAARSNLVLAGLGHVWVNADAMVSEQSWKKRVPSAMVPSAAKIGRALRNLATGSERVKIGDRQHKFHTLKVRLLLTWAERSGVVDVAALRARIEGPNEALAKALAARGLPPASELTA